VTPEDNVNICIYLNRLKISSQTTTCSVTINEQQLEYFCEYCKPLKNNWLIIPAVE